MSGKSVKEYQAVLKSFILQYFAFFRWIILRNVSPLEPLTFFSIAVTFVNGLLFACFLREQSRHTKRGESYIITFDLLWLHLFFFFHNSAFMEEAAKMGTIKSNRAVYIGNIFILINTQNAAVISDLNIHLLLFCALI